MKKLLFNSLGMSLATIMIFGTVVTGSIAYFAVNNVHNKAVSQSSSTLIQDTIMPGFFIYAENLLVNRKCLDLKETALVDIPPEDCNWETPGNLHRLIIPASTAVELANLLGIATPIKLSTIKLDVSIEDLAGDHPLRKMMNSVVGLKADQVIITYNIKDNSFIENIFDTNINVQLYHQGKLIKAGDYSTLIAPRMINTYAMAFNRTLTIGNLNIEDAKKEYDDGRIRNKIPTSPKASSKGITFHSPVFINDDLFIPSKEANKGKFNYTNFNSSIYLGGRFYTYAENSKSEEFMPDMDEKYIINYSGFKGIRGGLIPINSDRGLITMFSRNGAIKSNQNLKKCTEYAEKKYDAKATKNSRIVVRRDSDNEVRIGLTKKNEFNVKKSDNFICEGKDCEDIYKYSDGDDLDKSSSPIIKLTIKEKANLENYDHPFYIDEKDGKHNLHNKNYYLEGESEHFVLPKPSPSNMIDVVDVGQGKEPLYEQHYKLYLKDYISVKKDLLAEYKDAHDKKYIKKVPDPDCDKTKDKLDEDGNPILDDEGNPEQVPDCDDATKEVTMEADDFSRSPHSVKSNFPEDIHLRIYAPKRMQDDVTLHSVVNFKVELSSPLPDEYEFITDTIKFKLHVYDNLSDEDGKNIKDDDKWGPNNWSNQEIAIKLNQSSAEIKGVHTSIINSNWKLLDGGTVTLSPDEHKQLGTSASEKPEDLKKDCALEDGLSTEDVGSDVLNLDFDSNAFTSWNYNPISLDFQYNPAPEKDGDDITTFQRVYDVDNGDNLYGNLLLIDDHNDVLFHIYSIIDKCTVKAGAKYFMGFIVCRRLVIEDRKEPLEILGSIVVDQLEIHPRALIAGIDVRNIFHPVAIKKFKELGVMRSDCQAKPEKPFWHPSPESKELERIEECNPTSLMQKADPFRWTSFNPNCGLNPDNPSDPITKCLPKGIYKNYLSSPYNMKVSNPYNIELLESKL